MSCTGLPAREKGPALGCRTLSDCRLKTPGYAGEFRKSFSGE